MADTLRGADVLVEALKAAGTRYVFTLSGNHIMPVFDATIGSGIELIHVRHEGAAVHMADAWARLTGDVGIALVTGGPGHANAVGALYTALAAESPLVLLSGHAPHDELGLGAFQEMRQADIAAPLCKASWTVERAETLGADIARAIEIARSGRPGPVHVSLPSDVLDRVIARAAIVAPAAAPPLATPAAADIARLAGLIAAAARPLVVAAPRFDTAVGRALLDRVAAAHDVATAVMASPRGINDPSLGAFAEVLAAADLVVLLGKPLDFTLRFGRSPAVSPTARIVVVETDAALVARARAAFSERLVAVVDADAHLVATALAAATPKAATARRRDVEAAVAYRPAAWQTIAGPAGRMHSAEMCRTIAAVLAGHPDAILVADGGEIGQWAQAMIPTHRRVINGVAGSIGAALPFAIAARLAAPDAPVVAVMGDGTFGFHMAEIDTAVRYGVRFVTVVGNDARWNAEHQIQLKSYGADRTIGCELLPTHYDSVATALGGAGAHVTDSSSLAAALRDALAREVPTCIDATIDGAPAPVVRRS
jgi:acetolactate synthase-1/2/3 large subunit